MCSLANHLDLQVGSAMRLGKALPLSTALRQLLMCSILYSLVTLHRAVLRCKASLSLGAGHTENNDLSFAVY